MKKLIYLEDAIDAMIATAFSTATIYGRSERGMAAAKEAIRTLKALPSAEPRKTGHWIGHKADDPDWQRDDGTPIMLMCSACKAFVINNGASGWNYCPGCGSYNGGEQNEVS